MLNQCRCGILTNLIWYIGKFLVITSYRAWWRHQMATFSASLALYAGNSSVNSSHKGQWRGALMFSLICAWINDWVNNRETGDFRRQRARYDVTLMGGVWFKSFQWPYQTPLNTLRPKQNGRLFADDTFKRIFLNENIRISFKISLKFVPKGVINNIPALVLIMAWRRPGDKPSSEPMLVRSLTHICVTRPQWVLIGAISIPEIVFIHSLVLQENVYEITLYDVDILYCTVNMNRCECMIRVEYPCKCKWISKARFADGQVYYWVCLLSNDQTILMGPSILTVVQYTMQLWYGHDALKYAHKISHSSSVWCKTTFWNANPFRITGSFRGDLPVTSGSLNTLMPRKKWTPFCTQHFPMRFLERNIWILIKISLKFVPKGPITNIPALVEIMVWRRSGDKPLSEPVMINLSSLGLNELNVSVIRNFEAVFVLSLNNLLKK